MRRSHSSGPDNLDYFSGMGKLKMLKGLYFPGVRPDQSWAGALTPFVERLVVYAVGGEVSAAPDAPSPWEPKEVAPLGEDAPRFQALLREMTGRDAAVLRGQLLAMASRPGRDRDEASAGSLATAMHHLGSGGAAEDLAQARTERLWQARLFLKLAETVTTAEAEITLGLAALAGKQAEMLKALQGDDEADEPAEALPVVPLYRPRPGRFFRLRDQLAAWAVFYRQDPGPEPLLLSDDPEAAALLADEVEKRAPGQVLALPELELGLAEEDRAAVVKALQEMLAGQIETGMAGLQALLESRPRLPAAGGTAPMVLRLQLLPGVEFRQVMLELSGLPGEEGATALASPYVLVGAITPGEAYL